jgi:hypothetical protein
MLPTPLKLAFKLSLTRTVALPAPLARTLALRL